MPKAKERDSGLRMLGLVFGAIALWGITYAVASKMLQHSPSSAKLRVAAVVIGVAGFLSWQLVTARLIRAYDEFTRRIHLVALAIAFAATGLFIFTADLLQRAGFVEYISLMTIWLVMIGVWWLALLGAGWYYRR